MIGYKIIYNDKTRLLATLEIPSDAETNYNSKKNIPVDPLHATYKCDMAKVINIEVPNNNNYNANIIFTSGKSAYCPPEDALNYIVGQTTKAKTFSLDPNDANGISYFIDKPTALEYMAGDSGCLFYGLKNECMLTPTTVAYNDGIYKRYTINGSLETTITLKNGYILEFIHYIDSKNTNQPIEEHSYIKQQESLLSKIKGSSNWKISYLVNKEITSDYIKKIYSN